MSWYLETRSLLGDWQPQLWTREPVIRNDLLRRADARPTPVRNLRRIPKTEVEDGLAELHIRYGTGPVFRTVRRK